MAYFYDIVNSLVAQLSDATVGVLPNNAKAIVPITRKVVPKIMGDKDVLVRIRSVHSNQSVTAASGRNAQWLTRYVDIILRCRLYTDVSMQALQFLTHETKGVLAMEAACLDCMEMWQPADPDDATVPLLIQPARLMTGEDPVQEVVTSDPNDGMIGLRYELIYEQTLNQDASRQ